MVSATTRTDFAKSLSIRVRPPSESGTAERPHLRLVAGESKWIDIIQPDSEVKPAESLVLQLGGGESEWINITTSASGFQSGVAVSSHLRLGGRESEWTNTIKSESNVWSLQDSGSTSSPTLSVGAGVSSADILLIGTISTFATQSVSTQNLFVYTDTDSLLYVETKDTSAADPLVELQQHVIGFTEPASGLSLTSGSFFQSSGQTTNINIAADSLSVLRSRNAQAAGRLEELQALGFDWSGEGSQPPTKAASQKVAEILLEAETSRFRSTFIGPLVDGGLQIEWGPVGDRKLVVVVDGQAAEVEFVYIDERGINEATEGRILRISDLQSYFELIG